MTQTNIELVEVEEEDRGDWLDGALGVMTTTDWVTLPLPLPAAAQRSPFRGRRHGRRCARWTRPESQAGGASYPAATC
jgi:hypothetical protein